MCAGQEELEGREGGTAAVDYSQDAMTQLADAVKVTYTHTLCLTAEKRQLTH